MSNSVGNSLSLWSVVRRNASGELVAETRPMSKAAAKRVLAAVLRQEANASRRQDMTVEVVRVTY